MLFDAGDCDLPSQRTHTNVNQKQGKPWFDSGKISATSQKSGNMKVPLLRISQTRLPYLLGRHATCLLITAMFLLSKTTPLLAEGSKDLVNYPGYRLYLDTRDQNQQQMKVYAEAGEFINVGSSHTGIQGGFIVVISPRGDTMAIFNNLFPNQGKGIIFNKNQEMNGPSGTAGGGYIPGVVPVPTDSTGIWTVIFDYDEYQPNATFNNLLNTDFWTRANNQPNSKRVILAWDVTVTTGNPGDNGGNQLTGRVFTNEYVSVLNGNNVTTSPKFYVLTQDGYLYYVDIINADPFRFPISSNSLGLVNSDLNPLYKSSLEMNLSRSADTSVWVPGKTYLYEPQAEDLGEIINNKIFFNTPSPSLPPSAVTTDVYRKNPHVTWLRNELQAPELIDYYFLGYNPDGAPCGPNIIEFGKGIYFVFETNIGGSITLQLDLNNNGIFTDPVDTTITQPITAGSDTLFWNGYDGLGIPIAVQDSFKFNYKALLRFGEIHVALTDVENNNGGVTFKWMNAPPNFPTDSFYYDHSAVGPPIAGVSPLVSGGGTPGNPLPTVDPFTYINNFGNIKYLDQWSFVDIKVASTPVVVKVVEECDCLANVPALVATDTAISICSGDILTMSVSNTFAGIGDLTYSWSGPNNFSTTQTIGENETSTVTINNVTLAAGGTYTIIASNANGCADTITIEVTVFPRPNFTALTGGGSFCAGETATFTAVNLTQGIDTLFYTLSGPNTNINDFVTGSPTITISVGPLTEADEGTYTLTVTSEDGCTAVPVTANVTVNPTPVLAEVSGSGSYCEGDNVTLIVENITPGVGTMTCTVFGPSNNPLVPTINGSNQLVINLPSVLINQAGDYKFVCSFNGCTSDTLTLNVNIQKRPEINGESPNGDFCVGEDVNFTAENNVTGTGPLTYIWIGPGGDTLCNVSNAPELGPFPCTLPNVQPGDAGIYTIVLITSAGCESVPQTVEIGIKPTPEICNITGGGDLCVGQTDTLRAFNCSLGIGSITYLWQDPQGNQISTGTVSNNGPFIAILNDVQMDDAGIYTLTLTSLSSGCQDTATVSIDVLQGLNVIDITPDSNYCEGTDVTLTATTTTTSGQITYTWTGPNGFSFTQTVAAPGPLTTIITSVSVVDTGTYMLTVVSDAGCEAGPFSVHVGLNPTFNITGVTGGGEFCADNPDPIILVGTGTGTADSVFCVWTGPAGDTLSVDTVAISDPLSITLTEPDPGVYTLTCTTAEGCADSQSTTISFFDVPIANILLTDTSLCELDTLLLCGQNLNPDIGLFNYTWITPSGISITGQGNGTDVFCDELLPLATFGSGQYILVINNQSCPSVDTVNITLNPNPVISPIIGGGTFCEGDTVKLYFWNTNPAVDSFYHTCAIGDTTYTGIAGGLDTVCIFVTEPGFVFCSLESLKGCVSSLNGTEIIFQPTPVIEITSNSPVCANDTLLLNGINNAACTGTVTYTWTGPGNFLFTDTAPCGGPFPAEVVNPVAGEYCLIVANNNCADTACITVIVNEVPFVEGGLVNGGGDYCAGDNVELSAVVVNPSGGEIEYVWTQNGTPVPGGTGTVPSGSTVTLNLDGIEVSGAGDYCIELTCVTTGCESDGPDCATVNVLLAPENLVASGGGDYCEGVDVPLNGSSTPGPGNVTYSWTGPNHSFSDTAPNGGPYPDTVFNIGLNQSGVYTLVVETAAGCKDSVSVVINVNPMPIISNTGGGGTYCEGETATLTFTVDPNGADTVVWTVTCPDTVIMDTITMVTTVSIDILVGAATAGNCTIEATSNKGCTAESATETISITQVVKPVLMVSANDLCPGDELILSTNPQDGDMVLYQWFRNDDSIGVSTDTFFMVVPPQAGEYTVLVTVDDCASGLSDPVTVNAATSPDAVDDVATTDAGVPVSGNVTVNDTPTPPDVTVELVSGPANGTVEIDADGNFTYTPNATFAGGTDQFVYEICLADCPPNENTCDQATVTITVNVVECTVPNIITPDGNGINDVLFIDCLETGQFPNSRMRVFNRWGDEIASFEPYENNWDGTYGTDKKEVPAGTYFYLFEEDKTSGEKPKAGYVKVVR